MSGALVQLPFAPTEPPIRSSMINNLGMCERYFLFQDRYGLQTGAYRQSLFIGNCMHKMLKVLYDGLTFPDAQLAAAEFCVQEQEKLSARSEEGGTTGLLPSGKTLGQTLDTMVKDVSLASAGVSAFASKFPIGCMPETETIATELLIQFQVPEVKSLLRIQIDAIIRVVESGEVWIVDHKSLSSAFPTEEYAETLLFALQPALYRLGFSTYLESEENSLGIAPSEFVGSMHNIIRKPTIRLKKNQTEDEYIQEVAEWYKKQSSFGGTSLLQSWILFEGTPSYPAWLRTRIVEADIAARAMVDIDLFPPRDSMCRKWNKPCAYLELCKRDPDLWAAFAPKKYIQEFRDEEEI